MGANQSSETVGKSADADTAASSVGKPRLTYQESFDIRVRGIPSTGFVRPVKRTPRQQPNSRASFSSESDSDAAYIPSVNISRSTSRGVRRNKSGMRPPLLLFASARNAAIIPSTTSDQPLSGSRMAWGAQRDATATASGGGGFSHRKNSEVSQGSSQTPRTSFEQSETDIEQEIEQEIDMILNESREGKPWYHPHKHPQHHRHSKASHTASCSGSSSTSSTVSVNDSKVITVSNQSKSDDEDVYSTRSLPTPSFYLYLAYDGGSNSTEPRTKDEIRQKSQSIEVLDGPNYFFLNYDDDTTSNVTTTDKSPKEDIPDPADFMNTAALQQS